MRTLLDRCYRVVTKEDRENELTHIKNALRSCGYPKWTIDKVQKDINNSQDKKKGRGKKDTGSKSKGMVVLPYVKGLSESVGRVLKKHGISTAMRPHQTLRKALVRPKDKISQENMCGCIYSIGCKNCNSRYIGETGRKFSTRLSEHIKDSSNTPQVFTRAEKRASETVFNKSALTDHSARTNHVIDWEGAKVIDREDNRTLRQIKEAIWIENSFPVMNRDLGAYSLSHIYRPLFHPDQSSGESVQSRNQSQF